MNKAIGLGVGAAVIAGGVAIGYVAITWHVEGQVRAAITQPAVDNPGTTITVDEIVADPLNARVIVRGYETIALSGVDEQDAPVGDVSLSVEEIILDFDTTLFLTPVEEVKTLAARGIRTKFTVEPVEGAPADAPNRSVAFAAESMRAEGLGPAALFDESRPAPITNEEILAALDDPFHLNFLRMETVTVSTTDTEAPARFDAIEIEGATESDVERIELFGFTTTIPVESTLAGVPRPGARPPNAEIKIASFGLENVKVNDMARFGLEQSINPDREPSMDDILGMFEGFTLFVNGMESLVSDGSRYTIGVLRVGELAVEDGVPTYFRMEATDFRQEFPLELSRLALDLMALPVGIEPPEAIDSDMTIVFSTDTESDVSTVRLSSFDTFTDVTLNLDVAVGGLVATKQAMDQNPDDFSGATFNGLSLTLNSSTPWEKPGLAAGKLSPRLFALSMLNREVPSSLEMRSLLEQVRQFIMRGGRLEISAAPATPLNSESISVLQILSPQQQFELLGLGAAYSPPTEN